MALQAQAGLRRSNIPASLSPPVGSGGGGGGGGSSAGLRRSPDGFAFRSAFFSPSVHLLLAEALPRKAPAAAAAAAAGPRFSMRVASKQAYICRDCGYIYNDKTPFEKVPDNYFCP
ncbi:uncharacterized protein LOC109705242, partial [Ananas comosus]